MENVGKIVYKKPEYQRERPQEPTPEATAESERIAKGKLAKISDPNFKKFALRYMNIEEYRQMIETGVLGAGGREVNVLELTDGSVMDYMPYLARNAERHTDWTSTNHSYWLMQQLLDKVKKSEGETKRDRLEHIRREIIGVIQSDLTMNWVFTKTSDELLGTQTLREEQRERLIRVRSHMQDSGAYPSPEQEDALAAEVGLDPEWLYKFINAAHLEHSFGSENMRILNRLNNDPGYIEEPGALREIINAIIYSLDKRKHHDSVTSRMAIPSHERQYEVAVLFNSELLNLVGRSKLNPWDTLPSTGGWAGLTEQDLKRSVLAAVSMMPLKDLEDELIEIEKGSGDFAHPVFATVGDTRRSGTPRVVLRWPRS